MKISTVAAAVLLSLVSGSASAWAPGAYPTSLATRSLTKKHHFVSAGDDIVPSFSGDFLQQSQDDTLPALAQNKLSVAAPLAAALLPLEAQAADGSSGGQIASAFAAYGHYLSLFVIVGCLVTERLTIKANMSDEEEDRLAIADTTLGVSGALLAYTGYLRCVSDWGKGWEFYAHEPVFWLKTFFVAIFGAVSFFPTTKIIQRSVAKRNGNLEPMSEELAKRMTSLVNAELLMIGSIPLTASLMSRGVGYWQEFPWQLGAGATVAALGGLGFKYVKEALDWQEPTPSVKAEE